MTHLDLEDAEFVIDEINETYYSNFTLSYRVRNDETLIYGNFMFTQMSNLKFISWPKSSKVINHSCFQMSQTVSEVNMPEGLK